MTCVSVATEKQIASPPACSIAAAAQPCTRHDSNLSAMARQRRTALLAALLAALLCCSMAQTSKSAPCIMQPRLLPNPSYICSALPFSEICPDRAYTLHSNQKYCYQYFATPLTFFAASTACRNSRGSGGELVDITSAEENLWLREQYFAAKDDVEFWIGLNDVDVEGLFV